MRNTQGKDISLTVIMPGLNEEENIRASVAELLAALGDAVVDWEVIIIDDGSTDRTGEIAEEFARVDSRIRVLHHKVSMGIGYSFFEGIRSSTKEAVTWVPADGENDPRDLVKYLPLIQHVDIVIPFVVNKRVRPRFRRILSAVYLAIINATFRTRFNYTNGNIIYRKRVFDIVTPRSNGFLVNAECLVKATRAGFLFAEVPVLLKKRIEGSSKAFRFKSFCSVIREYVALLFSFRTLREQDKERRARMFP